MEHHWVFLHTDQVYKNNLPPDVETNKETYHPKYKKGKLHTVTFTQDGQEITLESVTTAALRQRNTHWVYPGTGDEYKGNLPGDLYKNLEYYQPVHKNKKLHTITFTQDGQEITLELVTATAMRQRQPHWVYPGTGDEYKGNLPEDLYQNLKHYQPKYKDKKLHTVTFTQNGKEITLEQVTALAMRHRRRRHKTHPTKVDERIDSITPSPETTNSTTTAPATSDITCLINDSARIYSFLKKSGLKLVSPEAPQLSTEDIKQLYNDHDHKLADLEANQLCQYLRTPPDEFTEVFANTQEFIDFIKTVKNSESSISETLIIINEHLANLKAIKEMGYDTASIGICLQLNDSDLAASIIDFKNSVQETTSSALDDWLLNQSLDNTDSTELWPGQLTGSKRSSPNTEQQTPPQKKPYQPTTSFQNQGFFGAAQRSNEDKNEAFFALFGL